MNAEQLEAWLELHLPQIRSLNLDPQSIGARHVLNWGGFVNHSFSIGDGSVRYHLKITDDIESIAKLRHWHKLHDLLERRYRAPKTIDWVTFDEIGFAGLLMEQIDGATVGFREHPVLVEQLTELAGRLHNDAGIRSYLDAAGSTKTYFDYFGETYMDRFTADLEAIEAPQLPFVSSTLFQWMRQETDRLLEAVNAVQAFHQPAVEAVHGDLNEGNVLVAANDWFVLDWDDLALGDPAVEFAVLLWPMVREGRKWREFPIPATSAGFAERLELCFRAQMLDDIVDPLADYVAAHTVPSKQAEVQLVKRRQHEEALERYRTRSAASM